MPLALSFSKNGGAFKINKLLINKNTNLQKLWIIKRQRIYGPMYCGKKENNDRIKRFVLIGMKKIKGDDVADDDDGL